MWFVESDFTFQSTFISLGSPKFLPEATAAGEASKQESDGMEGLVWRAMFEDSPQNHISQKPQAWIQTTVKFSRQLCPTLNSHELQHAILCPSPTPSGVHFQRLTPTVVHDNSAISHPLRRPLLPQLSPKDLGVFPTESTLLHEVAKHWSFS